MAVVGSTTCEVFEAYVRRVLVPTLRPGRIMVMNNIAARKGEKVRELIEEREAASRCTRRPAHRTSKHGWNSFPSCLRI